MRASLGTAASAEGARGAAHLREGLLGVAAHAGELGHRRLGRGRAHREGEVALADEVGDPLAQLVVQDAVVLRRVGRGRGVGGAEELLRPDLLGGDRAVHDRQLHAALGAEVVEQLAPSREDRPLVLLPGRLVAYVVEREGLAEQPLLDLGDAVAVEQVVAYRGVDVLRRAPGAPLLGHPPRELALLLGDPPLERLAARRRAIPAFARHASPPPSSCSPSARAGPPARTRRRPPGGRARCPSSTAAPRLRARAWPPAPRTSPREAPWAARSP